MRGGVGSRESSACGDSFSTFEMDKSRSVRKDAANPRDAPKGDPDSVSKKKKRVLQDMLAFVSSPEFDLQKFLEFMNKQQVEALQQERRLPILLERVSVRGKFENIREFPSVISSVNVLWSLFRKLTTRNSSRDKLLLSDIDLLIEDGELCLVLGRKGSGAECLVRIIGTFMHKVSQITGRFEYGGIDHKDFRKSYGNEAIYGSGHDKHVSSLTVGQTLSYCSNFMVSKLGKKALVHRRGYIEIMCDFVLRSLGISQTKNVNVGDEFHRGVSGGERRRVSLAEALMCDPTIIAFNNIADGLDSSTAYNIIDFIRNLVHLTGKTSVVSLSVVSNSLLYLFDKVIILEQGHLVYAGSAGEVCSYMESLGFVRHDFETDADYITGIIDSGFMRSKRRESQTNEGFSAVKLAMIYKESELYKAMNRKIMDYYHTDETTRKRKLFISNVIASKRGLRLLRAKTSFKAAYWRQLLLLTQRAFIISVQDPLDILLSLLVYIILALIIGVSFANMKISEAGIQDRKNFLFSCIIVNYLQGYSETVDNFRWREIISKHRTYKMYRNSAQNLGAVISRIPLVLFKVFVFTLIVYPLAFGNLNHVIPTLDFYFTNVIVTLISTSMFRFISTISATPSSAAKIASLFITFLITFSGFIVQSQDIISAFRILFNINPLNLALENNLITHIKDLFIPSCPESDLVPNGPSYTGRTKSTLCTFEIMQGGNGFRGEQYLKLAYGVDTGDYLSNLAALIAAILFFVVLLSIGAELRKFNFDQNMTLCVKDRSSATARFRRYIRKKFASIPKLKKLHAKEKENSLHSSFEHDEHNGDSRIFPTSNFEDERSLIWRNVSYRIKIDGEPKLLLSNVSGYAKGGVMTALMGASGAGKTTLLDVIVGRRSPKHITGEVYLDKAVFDKHDHRKYAYCEQMDILLETATVREALKFSAHLRQDRNIPRKVKDKFVENMINILELEPYADAIIGNAMLGYGINKGLQKLVTIGIELCSRPSTILLLDEPTTGLDSKSALEVIRVLRKLANSGLAIVCTVHQPTRTIFDQFDNLILVSSGGKISYFGEVGRDGTGVLKFFFDRGVRYDPSLSIPEFIIDVVRQGSTIVGSGKNWAEEWLKSRENEALNNEIEKLLASRGDAQPTTNMNSSEIKKKDEPPHFFEKLRLVVSRDLKWMWRSPSYTLTRVLNHEMIGIFMLTIFLVMKKSSDDVDGLTGTKEQAGIVLQIITSVLSAFQLLAIPALLIPSLIPKFITLRLIHDREESSGTHSKGIFALSMFISELPLTIICPCMLVTTYYFSGPPPIHLSNYFAVCFMASLLSIYALTLGLWIASVLPSFYIGARFTPLIVMPFGFFSGILIPYRTLSEVFKKTLYYINPFSWGLMAILYRSVKYVEIPCGESAMGSYRFRTSPPGMDCLRYVSEYVKSSSKPGTFGYAMRTGGAFDDRSCVYCPLSNSKELLSNYGDLGHGSSFFRSTLVVLGLIIINLILYLVFSTRLKMSKA